MLVPATAGSGESDLVTAMSACVATVVVAVPVLLTLFGSTVVLAAVALFVIVEPSEALALPLTTMLKTAVSPAATVPFEKVTLPVPPTAGAEIDQPEPVVTAAEKNV